MSDSTATQSVIDYQPTPKVSGGSILNFRILVFVLVIAAIIFGIGYMWWSVVGTHGIRQSGDAYQVDLKSMSTFPFDQRHGTIDDVPARYRELDGKKVELIGEMWAPGASSPRLKKFDLVYSIAKCCFSGPPQIQHFVKSTTVGDPAPYYEGLVRVTGTLKVEVTKDPDGTVSGIYHVAVESVNPV
jgi:hypothetical protein